MTKQNSFLTVCSKILFKDGSIKELAGMPSDDVSESLASLLSMTSEIVEQSDSEVQVITFLQSELRGSEDSDEVSTKNAIGIGFLNAGLISNDMKDFYKLIDSEKEELLP